jgi:small GTP-binding protein
VRTLNLGILAHVDAGKTSLTERLLYAAGVIDEIGSVDDGSTQTDSLDLERQRGLTIKSAVVSFVIGDVTVNLIDTPGHPDFIAEVERVLSVLDGAVLVISAVEGVQAQTRVLMRTLRRLHIPTLIFVNKIDRAGAGYERVLRSISEKLDQAVIPMGSASGLGTRDARSTPYGAADVEFTSRLVELLADHDDALLAAYLADETAVSHRQLRGQLAAQTRQALVYPVFFGSAITGADFRGLTPLVVMSALAQAGTRVYEPMHRFQLELPADTLGAVLPVLARLRAVPQAPAMGGSSYLIEGEIPAAQVHELQQQLPALTRGEGVLECAFDHYQPVRGATPTRPRSDHNPLNRKEYLLRIKGRV